MSDSQSRKGNRDVGQSVKKELMIEDIPQINEEETIESSDKNEDKNEETGEDMELGDISSNLGGYPASKDDTGKNDEDEILDNNEGLDNIGNEVTNHGVDGEENVEEVGKEKDLGKEEAKGMEHAKDKKMNDLTMGAMLTFLDTTKMKFDSSL